MIVRINKSPNPLFVLFTFICISGAGYLFYSIKIDHYEFWVYDSAFREAAGTIANLINRLRDYFVLLWFIVATIRYRERYFAVFLAFILYGALVLYANGNDNYYIIVGVRAYIYVFMVYHVFRTQILDSEFWKGYTRLFKILSLLQLWAVYYVWRHTGSNYFPGSDQHHRMIGLFTSAGLLGAFVIGGAILFSYSFVIRKEMAMPNYIIWMLVLIFLGVSSGGRMPIFFASMWMVVSILSKMEIKEGQKYALFFLSMVLILPPVLSFSENIIGRGTVLSDSDVRFNAWVNMMQFKRWQVLLGHGLGIASNSTNNVLGSEEFAVGDSNYVAIIMQYGILGFAVFVVVLFKLIYGIIVNNMGQIMFVLYAVAVILVQLFAGNVIEQYACSVPTFLVLLSLLRTNDSSNEVLENNMEWLDG